VAQRESGSIGDEGREDLAATQGQAAHAPAAHWPEAQPDPSVHAVPIGPGAAHLPPEQKPDMQNAVSRQAPPFATLETQTPLVNSHTREL
jgi:hypothetical protein